MTYPNGMVKEMSFEGDMRIAKVEHYKKGILFDQVQSLFKYEYDYNDNRTKMETFRKTLPVNEILNYTYDQKDQLLTATNPLRNLANETFTYDLAGNILKQAGQTTNSNYNENNQITDDETYTYKHDIKGNMIEKKHKTSNETTRYHWSIENQLIRVTTHETENAMPSETITYAYDGLGRRIEKNINGEIKRYIYDNEDILMEFDEENAFKRYYMHGLGIDEPLAMLVDNKDTRDNLNDLKAYYYHTDAMGSIISITDEQANEKEKYVYNAFGKMTIYDERDRKIASSQIGNSYSFTGREHDSETGLHYHRARYYSPELARWISEDPIEFDSGDLNLYRYVENNPLYWIDPDGEIPALAIPFIVSGIGTISGALQAYLSCEDRKGIIVGAIKAGIFSSIPGYTIMRGLKTVSIITLSSPVTITKFGIGANITSLSLRFHFRSKKTCPPKKCMEKSQ